MALYVVLPIGTIQLPCSLFVGTFLPPRNPYLGQVARAFCAFGTITESRRQAYPGHAAYNPFLYGSASRVASRRPAQVCCDGGVYCTYN